MVELLIPEKEAGMFDNLNDVAFTNGKWVKGKIKAVVLGFHGLGSPPVREYPELSELELAAAGGLFVFPYYGPWSWMNRPARKLVDEIVEQVYKVYNLDDSVPLIITGGSMGGHAALNYVRYSKRKPAAVACNCPVTDPRFHYSERSDLPRTFILAYGLEGQSMDEAFKENSPVEQAENMPLVPYFIIHGDADKSVNKAAHSDIFVKRMKETGHEVEYVEAPEMRHCVFNDYSHYRRWMDFIMKYFLSA
jgi:dipeptidyl aminopeptidase/acylaminoacyl peptidase